MRRFLLLERSLKSVEQIPHSEGTDGVSCHGVLGGGEDTVDDPLSLASILAVNDSACALLKKEKVFIVSIFIKIGKAAKESKTRLFRVLRSAWSR